MEQYLDIVPSWVVGVIMGDSGILPLQILPRPPAPPGVAELAVSLSSLAPVNFLTSLPALTGQCGSNPILLDY